MKKILTPINQTIHTTVKIFVDLDNVLVDFSAGAIKMFEILSPHNMPTYSQIKYETDESYKKKMWELCWDYQNNHNRELWYECPMMDDAMILWEYVKPYSPEILSATGPSKYKAKRQKLRWVAEKLGEDIVVNLTFKAVDKSRYAAPHHILIDDKPKAIKPWVEKGGIGIIHTSAENTICQLEELGL